MAFFPSNARVEFLDDMAALFRAGEMRSANDPSYALTAAGDTRLRTDGKRGAGKVPSLEQNAKRV